MISSANGGFLSKFEVRVLHYICHTASRPMPMGAPPAARLPVKGRTLILLFIATDAQARRGAPGRLPLV